MSIAHLEMIIRNRKGAHELQHFVRYEVLERAVAEFIVEMRNAFPTLLEIARQNSASPDLFAALEALVAYVDDNPPACVRGLLNDARAAISKAEGK